MEFAVELEQENDGRWIAEIHELDGVLVYGATKEEAIRNVKDTCASGDFRSI